MKKILLTLMTLIGLTSYSQTDTSSYYLDPKIFDNEWRLSLKEKVNFITFHQPSGSNTIEFRIYRGEELEYDVSIFNNTGQTIRTYKLKPSDSMDLESLEKGFYFIIVKDKNENKITKVIRII